jgi:type IV fimbrial biogenesis protein FimT
MKLRRVSPSRGLTLIELMVVLAVAAVLIALAAPSFTDFILLQRLKSVNAQLVTDLQYARSEAVSRGVLVHVRTNSEPAGDSCYIVFTAEGSLEPTPACDCLAAPGNRCPLATTRELKSVVLARDRSVKVDVPSGQASLMAFDSVNGALVVPPVDDDPPDPNAFIFDVSVDAARRIRTLVGLSGRPSVCAPPNSSVGGAAC